MKKLAVLIVCTAVMASCDSFSGGSKDQLKAENDSLLMELTQRNAELDEMMGTFNDISEGFRQINAAESRVDLQRGAVAEGSLNAKQQIASDIEFIRKQMEENKEQIAKLQSMLKNSKTNSSQLKRAVESLTQELNAKTQRIEELQAELASKNIRIQELDAAVIGRGRQGYAAELLVGRHGYVCVRAAQHHKRVTVRSDIGQSLVLVDKRQLYGVPLAVHTEAVERERRHGEHVC